MRIGPYFLTERLGEGGMGEVYRAERVEDFTQIVAVKLLTHGVGDEETLRRFHTEQQVLANLNHPNIVRLLDAGVSGDGVPYLAMEYVEGTPLDRFCEERHLDRDARLYLILQVLDALEYAHQRFLVHCDLKYSNILVSEDGTVKLLDFGIAKLLRPAQYGQGDSLTQEFRPITLEFASPEQLQAAKLSTASDIYAAGLLLYGLLTGQHPFEDALGQPVALVEAIQTADPEPPSNRARRIATPPVPARRIDRDLDAITGKSLRKEPEQRYRSAERFAADLRHYLGGHPVEARERSFAYRAGKFIRRNRATSAVGAVLAVAVALGVAGTILESVRAQQHRRRAEARFSDTRKLANSLLFGFYDSVSKLPNASHAQQLLVARSLTYLDSLAGESKGNDDLQLDLADGYVRLASLEGPQALATADKAIDIASVLARAIPRDFRAYLTLAGAHGAKADALLRLGRGPESLRESRTAIEISDRLLAERPDNVPALLEAAKAHESLGDKLSAGEQATALAEYRRALELMTSALKLAPSELRARRAVVVQRMKIAGLISDRDPEQGRALLEDAVRGFDSLGVQEQQENTSRRLHATLLRRLAEMDALLGRDEEAGQDFALAQKLTDAMLVLDSRDARTKLELALVLEARGRFELSREYSQRVVNLLSDFPALEQSKEARAALDYALINIGDRKSVERGSADFRALVVTKDVSPDVLEKAAESFLEADPRFALECVNRALSQGKTPVALWIKAKAFSRLGEKHAARTVAQSGLALLPASNPDAPARGLRLQLTRLASE